VAILSMNASPSQNRNRRRIVPSARMWCTSSKRWAKIIGTTVVLTLLAIYLYYPYSPEGRQHRNMRLAKQHLPKLQTLVAADNRFSRVRLHVYTGNGGSLELFGAVRSDDDLAALKQTVAASSPPTAVTWHVFVIPPPAFDDWQN
jgi:hypothetical protein